MLIIYTQNNNVFYIFIGIICILSLKKKYLMNRP